MQLSGYIPFLFSRGTFFLISNKILLIKKRGRPCLPGVLGGQNDQVFKLQCPSKSKRLEQGRDVKATLQSRKKKKKKRERFNLKGGPFTNLKTSRIPFSHGIIWMARYPSKEKDMHGAESITLKAHEAMTYKRVHLTKKRFGSKHV